MAAKNQGTKPRPKAQNAAKKKPAAKKRAVSKPAAPKTKTYSKTPKKSSYKKRTAKQSSGYNIHSDAFDAESYFRRRRNIKGIMLICISVIFILLFYNPNPYPAAMPITAEMPMIAIGCSFLKASTAPITNIASDNQKPAPE